MKAVTGTLAPSYASGAQAWKGTIAPFRKNARITSTTAARAIGSAEPSAAAKLPIDIEPEELEDPAKEFGALLDEAMASDVPLTADERRARAGVASRQVTLR
jgi:hypothetical protein